MVRVRIAPSPTGIPHIGNTRTALFNFLLAKHTKGKFFLRIEDTDQKRIVPGAKEAIVEILNWLELYPDEIYIQSERIDLYKQHAKKLIEKEIAYEKDGAIWVKIPQGLQFSWVDAIGEKHISFSSENIEDFVIVKSDGFPTYHLASVVDDHLMEISHVIRGEEWISSTPKHIYLYQSFGWELPVFAHLPVILGPDKSKLSKRHGAESVLDYRAKGYLKEAILNFMVLLGWNPGGDKEILSLDEMVQSFDLKDVNTGSPVFDQKKLEWMNGVYIREKIQTETLEKMLIDFDPELKHIDKKKFSQLASIAKTRGNTVQDISNLLKRIMQKPTVILTEQERKIKENVLNDLRQITTWNKETVGEVILQKYVFKKVITYKDFYRIFLGIDNWLPLPDTFAILGKEETLVLIT